MDSRRLNEKASQETLISLLQLDPTPIESPQVDRPGTDKDLRSRHQGPSESGDAAGNTTSVGLSGSGHGAAYYLIRIQRYSSYTLSIFTTLHLVTTSLIPLATRSVPASESYLLLAREIYQTPLSEPLLVILPAAVHVASGLTLRLVRRAHNLRRYGGATPGLHALGLSSSSASAGWPPFSYTSLAGYALAILATAHAAANRVLPLAVEGDSSNVGLAYVAHAFARHPATAWLAYASLLAAAAGHIVWGTAKWCGLAHRASWRPPPPTGNLTLDRSTRRAARRTWLAINGLAASFAALWAAGGLGVVARAGPQPGWVGKLYDGLFDRIPGL